jgi:serine/threonine protein kinase/Tol biopolymer transport system component
MPLNAGARLGPYEIISPIGAGGMGEVYKARDTRLDRTVAIKLIQSHVAADPEFRERFEREAKAISALDHPHICTLYDLGHDASADYLVMQYLEGETLADRLARAASKSDPARPPSSGATTTTIAKGPIPLDQALRFAAEIARALDAAHRRGIVHRDLKPGNVMLTKSGTKLLDFGLAKLAAQEAGVAGFGGATRTTPLTSQGAILGTLHYMSPEQLEGREVDARSDIFSFGALFYEMLTGRRAFDSPSQAGMIAAVMAAEPPPLGELADLRAALPIVARTALDRVVRKCLAKNPDERWQSAADLADELSWVNEERLRNASEPVVAGAMPPPASRVRERLWMGVAALAAASAVGLGLWLFLAPAHAPAPMAFTVESPPGADPLATGPGLLSLSPDGSRLAFATGTGPTLQLWIRPLDSLTAQRVERASGAWHPFWSPDGRFIAFGSNSAGLGTLKKIDVSGSPPLTLAEATRERGAWGRAGVVLFTGRDQKLYRVPQAGGQPALAMDLDASRQETRLSWPMFLPDGQRFVVLASGLDPSTSALFLASLDSPARTHVVNAHSNVDYADGFLFYQRDGTLMAHPFDERSGRLTGEAMPVVENVQFNPLNGRGAFSVSTTGTIAYRAGAALVGTATITWFDRTGKPLNQVGQAGSYSDVQLSPDGRRLVVAETGRDAQSATTLWLMDVERGVPTKFTVGAVDESAPVWSPDGAAIVFRSIRNGINGLYRRQAGGGATSDELLYESPEEKRPTGFSPDGRLLLFTQGTYPAWSIWALPLDGGRKPVPVFPGSTTRDSDAAFSPDGRWIAYASAEGSGPPDVYVQPYPADGRRFRLSATIGWAPHWTADGKRVIFSGTSSALMEVEVTEKGGTLQPGAPRELFRRLQAGIRGSAPFAIDPRAERLLLLVRPESEDDQSASPITVLVNWTARLRKQ